MIDQIILAMEQRKGEALQVVPNWLPGGLHWLIESKNNKIAWQQQRGQLLDSKNWMTKNENLQLELESSVQTFISSQPNNF
jgi:hypothetical protein